MEQIEESCYKTMEMATDIINNHCGPLKKTLSPNVANLQIHLSMFLKKEIKKIIN